jgi:hypothetical protein
VDLARLRRPLLTAFLVWNVVAVWAAVVPGAPSPLRARVIALTRPYLGFTGLWQSWDMFAPHPQSFSAAVEAIVTRANGAETTWTIPGPEHVRFGKYRLDRWRKWRDAARADGSWMVWPDVARFAARQNTDSSNPPAKVELVRRWGDVPPPRPGDSQPREFPRPINEITYFASDVAQLNVAP